MTKTSTEREKSAGIHPTKQTNKQQKGAIKLNNLNNNFNNNLNNNNFKQQRTSRHGPQVDDQRTRRSLCWTAAVPWLPASQVARPSTVNNAGLCMRVCVCTCALALSRECAHAQTHTGTHTYHNVPDIFTRALKGGEANADAKQAVTAPVITGHKRHLCQQKFKRSGVLVRNKKTKATRKRQGQTLKQRRQGHTVLGGDAAYP